MWRNLLKLLLVAVFVNVSMAAVDVNSASKEELMKIKGIGATLADRIIEGRCFEKLDDLLKVDGIGAKRLEKFKEQLEVGPCSK